MLRPHDPGSRLRGGPGRAAAAPAVGRRQCGLRAAATQEPRGSRPPTQPPATSDLCPAQAAARAWGPHESPGRRSRRRPGPRSQGPLASVSRSGWPEGVGRRLVTQPPATRDAASPADLWPAARAAARGPGAGARNRPPTQPLTRTPAREPGPARAAGRARRRRPPATSNLYDAHWQTAGSGRRPLTQPLTPEPGQGPLEKVTDIIESRVQMCSIRLVKLEVQCCHASRGRDS